MSWLKKLQGSKAGSGPLTGKTLKVQSYSVKVENVLGEGGFATIYRCSDNTTKAAFALKHFRLRWAHCDRVEGRLPGDRRRVLLYPSGWGRAASRPRNDP
jgi:hypothetical protein